MEKPPHSKSQNASPLTSVFRRFDPLLYLPSLVSSWGDKEMKTTGRYFPYSKLLQDSLMAWTCVFEQEVNFMKGL